MINADGYFDWAIKDPGPQERQNGGRNGGKGMVPHSAEGYWPVLRQVLWGDRGSSWGASNLKDGRFIQHYSVWAQTWTSGAGYPNNNFFAFENEGVAGQPLTKAQTDNIIRAGKELMAVQGWKPRRPVNDGDLTASLYEHRECTRWGALGTACPSGRIPWDIIVPALTAQPEEDDMTERVWDGARTWLVGKGGATPVLSPEADKTWRAIYGEHTRVMKPADLEKIRVK